MSTTFTIAFMLGFAGSIHCIGMCGPLALAVPVRQDHWWHKTVGTLHYNLGRMSTYGLLGLLPGMAGQGMLQIFSGTQSHLSIILGVFILLFLLLKKTLTNTGPFTRIGKILYELLRETMGNLFVQKKRSPLFLMGLLNGLLPCGMVYLALVSSMATGDAINSMTFMFFFGAGTIPTMLSFTLMGNILPIRVRIHFRQMIPYLLAFIGTLLILRGLHLGIPYISPENLMGDNRINCQK